MAGCWHGARHRLRCPLPRRELTVPGAGTAAKVLGADEFEIVPEKAYTKEDLNYNDETTRATVEQKDESARPAIKNKLEGLEKYDTVVIAYPIWWNKIR